jgi:glutamate-5-semialdehyde dehydrogenase
MAGADTVVKNGMLSVVANALDLSAELIKAANKIDLDKAIASGKDKVFIDRLTLTDSRIKAMSDGVRAIISLNDPVGEVIEEYSVPSGLNIMRVRAPLGVIAIIYEARPNVTVDCFALTIKSGNSVILRGSKDAINSNRELYRIIAKALSENGYNSDAVQFIDDESRESTFELLQQKDNIDVVIPRGSDSLKDWVLQNSTIPVIASAGGNCHTYVEKTADLKMAEEVVFNAKVQRPSVCNATEQLIVDKDIAEAFLPACLKKLSSANVKILGDDITCKLYPAAIPSTDEDYYTEHLDYIISVKVLSDYNEAISWINEHTTRHSESIITNDEKAAREFTRRVDAAAVYVNASTRFTDGYEFGLGAEMGISTQKLHARGPIGLRELTSIKFVVTGTGQIRK